ncbi:MULTISPECIES: hypothetical protein [Clostridium]|uniref:hypothetical protein n=1 Tax=Clostridium TaxID=1485 RepID=UPI0001794B84|nr:MULTISPECIES: hypothetical protein [Clostridium]MDU2833205.1 hypothetical protein [Clostridium botulinum]EDU36015.1 hypothetical protein CLOSPO_02183 [Clostridium sporogenes ATCC 15579]MCW6078571.1 hypothetical protein [Clostridium sporogenes]MCW6095127.1 hypothetical protein [Clostridium sporogenes]MDU4546032.1 hypothetical protein [Clostridium botulinum]
MITEDRILSRELNLINEKLDYLLDKAEHTDETLNALINITLSPPSDSIPEDLINKDKSDVCTYAVDPGALRPCVFKYVYIWLDNGNSFWAWLTYVGRKSASGWRWNSQRWVYFGVDLNCIDYFECY